MSRDDIIRLAREAKAWQLPHLIDHDGLERFAALVAAPLEEEIKRLRFCIPEGDAAAAMEYLAHCVEKAVAAERDRMIAEGWRQCAEGQSTTQFCATAHQAYLDGVNSGIEAAAIRARGTP